MDDCIKHYGRTDKHGYGIIQRKNKKWFAHRLAWTDENGPIPEGMQVQHLCNNPICVNIKHLILGTNSENQLYSVKSGRHPNAEKTHCDNGHEFTPENTYIRLRSGRACRTCHRERTRARMKARS